MNSTSIFATLLLGTLPWVPLFLPINRNFEYEYSFKPKSSLSCDFPDDFLATELASFLDRWGEVASPASLILSLIPMLFSYVVGTCQCSPRESLLWFAIQWVPQWLCAWVMPFLIDFINRQTIAGKIKAYIYLGLFTLFFVIPASSLFLLPQKRMTSYLVGYLHGPIYDLWLPIDWGLIISRTIHILISLFAIMMLRPHAKVLSKIVWAPGLVAMLIANVIPFPSSVMVMA